MHVKSVENFLDRTDFAEPIFSLWDQAIVNNTPYTFPLIYCVQLFIVKKNIPVHVRMFLGKVFQNVFLNRF